jgi:GNAT superfamily N-acetyltransferase
MLIREAEHHDLEVLCDLYGDFHEFHVRGIPSRLASLKDAGPDHLQQLASRIGQIMVASDAALFVAEHESEILGFAEVYVREDEPSRARVTGRYGYLQSMFVRGDHRREGIGSALLDACESWARSAGLEEMRLDTWEFREGPSGFYEHRGYRTIRRSFTRSLE